MSRLNEWRKSGAVSVVGARAALADRLDALARALRGS